VRVGRADAPVQVVRAFTGRTARELRAEFAHLCGFAKVLWSPSYFVASVGSVWESMVRRDVEHQWDAVAWRGGRRMCSGCALPRVSPWRWRPAAAAAGPKWLDVVEA
jgi:hypothetical protein